MDKSYYLLGEQIWGLKVQGKTFLFYQSVPDFRTIRNRGLCNSLGCFSHAKNS